MRNRWFLIFVACICLMPICLQGRDFLVTGRVFRVDGKPCASAKITIEPTRDANTVLADSMGVFRLVLSRTEPRNLYVSEQSGHICCIPMMTNLDDSVFIDVRLDTLNQGTFLFNPSNSSTSRFAHLHTDLAKQYMAFVDGQQAIGQADAELKSFYAAWADSANQLTQSCAAEQQPILRGEYLLRYYRLTTIHRPYFDSLFFFTHLADIPAISPLWFFNNYEAFDQRHLRRDGEAFFDSLLHYHPSRELRAFLLFESAMVAQSAMNQHDVLHYYTQLKAEFADIFWAKIADQWIMPVDRIRAGMRIPDFCLRDLDDSTRQYTNTTLLGRYYLLDFWATWCVNCINEIPYLQRAYDKFHLKGLEIISVSSDLKKSDIVRFRSSRFKMPWKHVWLFPEEFELIRDTFAVTGIPKPILVDPNGNIVGVGTDLRGDLLEKALSKILPR